MVTNDELKVEDGRVLLSVAQARVALGNIGKETLYKLLNEGWLEGVRLGGRTMIRDDSLRALPDKLARYKAGEGSGTQPNPNSQRDKIRKPIRGAAPAPDGEAV